MGVNELLILAVCAVVVLWLFRDRVIHAEWGRAKLRIGRRVDDRNRRRPGQ